MYGILGEDKSDADTLAVIVKRLAGNPHLSVRGIGYGGSGDLLKKGARDLRALASQNFSHFIICYDADGDDPQERKLKVVQRVIYTSGLEGNLCVVIPIQELEAWILANLSCANQVFRGWTPSDHPNPESILKPKQFLVRLSRMSNKKPRYSHATHNPRIAEYLDLEKVYQNCSSFRPLKEFVTHGVSNVL